MKRSFLAVILFFTMLIAYSQQPKTSRPQTPVGPFPYTIDSLVYHAPGDSLQYGVTITKPTGKGPFPAIVLITGSGSQDRDETIMNHKPFAVLADFLTKLGYLVMRVDDRGVGLSGGDPAKSTSYDFAVDVHHHVDYLLTRKDVNPKKIGLLGHSEGGLIAPIVASERKDLAFLVLLAAPGIPIARLMAEQNEAILRSNGIDSIAAASYGDFFSRAMPKVAQAKDTASAKAVLMDDLKEWRAKENPNRVFATTGVRDDKSAANYVSLVVKQLYTPWFRVFLPFDPQHYLRKINCPVLALNGSRDIQVLPESNSKGIRESLAAGGNKNAVVEVLPGLNHLFQSCKACTIMEYGVLSETFSPLAMEKIGDWLRKEISPK